MRLVDPLVNSSKEMPDMNDMYAGTSGSTHGEIKEIIPAENAAMIEISGNFAPHLIDNYSESHCGTHPVQNKFRQTV